MLQSKLGLGALLLEGIGDTMRVSLTADPVEEVKFAVEILKSVGLRSSGINFVSCPTCGRTKINLQGLAEEVEEKLKPLERELEAAGRGGITVAVMGCAVNGPGEARDADIGIAGGEGCAVIFSKGELLRKIPEDRIVPELLAEINKLREKC